MNLDDEKDDQEINLEQDDNDLEDSLEDLGADSDIEGDDDDYDYDDIGGGSGRRSSVDDLKAIDLEKALRANPKRGQSQRQGKRPLDGINSISELSDPETASRIWAKFEEEFADAEAHPYGVDQDYSLEDVITHTSFGRGYVVEVCSNTKFVVLFQDGIRRLMYNIKS